MKLNKTLLKGSIILLFSFGIYNFLNFIFQFSMARMLSLEQYGIIATLFSMIYIFSIFADSIQMVVTRYTSREKDFGRLRNITKRSFNRVIKISFWAFILYVLVIIPLSFLLKIDYIILLGNGLIIFSVFMLPVSRGIMQGRKNFSKLGINMVSESIIKLIISVLLVFFGMMIYGALIGIVLGPSIAFAISLIQIKEIKKGKEKNANLVNWKGYSGATFVVIFVITVFYSIDIIIARIMFSPEVSGAYAIASILSKAIFWGTQPVSRAMFPLSSENGKKSKDNENILKNSFLIILILIFIALCILFFFSELIIEIFAGKTVNQASSILLYLGIAMSILSITNLILLYKLSLNKITKYSYLIIALIIEIALLFYFSNDLVQFSFALVVSSTILLAMALKIVD